MSRYSWFAPCHPAQLVFGLTIWSIWFVAMYAGLSVACQLAAPASEQGAVNWLNASLFLLTLLVLAVLLALAWRTWRACLQQRKDKNTGGVKHFTGYVSTVLYLASAIATLAGGLPVLVFAPCS
ncbi:hypothetical protein [Arsukibacterium indicum]|uniref:Uncharacterized protein n=1 Tax=Arsukibacterium indicum TaxID=2848612 RepID=A0ABS6MI15_9GAMM|nr:hypothetical protein [Arsukibacterium indicum]MBV2128448.1 hypothetical protein [Arsukibacterium indicum]